MSLANLTQLHPSHHSKLQFAALEMERGKAEKLRAAWEQIESTNTEKLEKLLSNVEKITQRANSPLCKAQVRIGDFIFNTMPGLFGGFCVAPFTAGYLAYNFGHAVSQQPLIPAIAGAVGVVGTISVGIYCVAMADKYEKTNAVHTHNELFRLITELSDSTNPKLHACMQQLYKLGADDKIPVPFWKRCASLLRQIESSASAFKAQQKHFDRQREKLNEIDPQVQLDFESVKSFAQRHENFVKVATQKEDVKDVKKDVGVKTMPNIIKI